MRIRRIAFVLLFAFVAASLCAAAALAADPARVATVISVKVNGDRQVYLEKVKTLEAISTRLGIPRPRVWRETFGGSASDTIHIVTEYASMAAAEQAQMKSSADPEWAKLIRDLDTSGIRTVLGRSMMVDDTPK